MICPKCKRETNTLYTDQDLPGIFNSCRLCYIDEGKGFKGLKELNEERRLDAGEVE